MGVVAVVVVVAVSPAICNCAVLTLFALEKVVVDGGCKVVPL